MKYITEIFLTSDHVTEENWLNLLNSISNLNGIFRKWNLWVQIKNNEVRYFVQTRRQIPTVISPLGDFLLKQVDEPIEKIKSHFSLFYFFLGFFKKKENSVLDVYDYNETRRCRELQYTQFTMLPLKQDYFRFHTRLYFSKNGKTNLKRKFAFFSIPQTLLSINFMEHSRFLYKKDAKKYLNIEKSLHLLKNDNQDAVLKVDTFPYLAGNYYLNLNDYDFDVHSLVVGASGTGKSKFISNFISEIAKREEFKNKYKVVVIDPHASLEKDIGGLSNSEVIDFKTLQNSMDLFVNTGKDPVVSTELMLSLLKGLMADQYNSKAERVLRHSIYTLLVKKELNFNNLRRIILDMDYRNRLMRELEDKLTDSTIDFFSTDFNELKSKSYQEAISPIISLIDEMQMLPAFHTNIQQKPMHEAIQENFLTIFSLDQTVLGEKITKTIAGLVMQQMLELVQSYTFDQHIIFVIDEVAVVENEILHRFLAEARKYNLSLMLAQQYFNQISEGLQKAIFANVLNYYVFRVSREDAIILEGNIQMEMAVHNAFHSRREMITKLANRECIVRVSSYGKVLSAMKARTIDFTPIPRQKVSQILNTKHIYLKEEDRIRSEILERNSYQEEILGENKEEPKIKKGFSIGKSISLSAIMNGQSTGREQFIQEQFER